MNSVRYRRTVSLPFTSLVSHRKPLSLLYSVRYRRAVSLPPTSLVSHRKSLSLTLPPAAVLHLNSVRYRRAVSLPLTSLVSHRKSLSLFLPPAAVELISPTGGGHYLSSVRSSRLSRSARYSVQNQRGASPSLAPLVFHGTSFSFLLSLAAVVLGSSQLTDKKSPSCTLFDIGVLFRSRSHHLYLTESRSPLLCHRQRSSLFLPLAAVITCPLFVRLISLAPLVIFRNSQIKNLPSELCSISARCFAPAHITCISQKVALPYSATGSGRACFSHWRRSLLVLCSFVSSHSLRS